MACTYAPDEMVPTVPMTPTLLLCVTRTSARAPGSTTPTTGTGISRSSSSSATEAAVLHATTISLTPKSLTRLQANSRAYPRTSSAGLLP